MKELLIKIDGCLNFLLPSILAATLVIICPKAIGQVSYSWLASAFPIIAYIISVGIINFLLFIFSRLDRTIDEDEY